MVIPRWRSQGVIIPVQSYLMCPGRVAFPSRRRDVTPAILGGLSWVTARFQFECKSSYIQWASLVTGQINRVHWSLGSMICTITFLCSQWLHTCWLGQDVWVVIGLRSARSRWFKLGLAIDSVVPECKGHSQRGSHSIHLSAVLESKGHSQRGSHSIHLSAVLESKRHSQRGSHSIHLSAVLESKGHSQRGSRSIHLSAVRESKGHSQRGSHSIHLSAVLESKGHSQRGSYPIQLISVLESKGYSERSALHAT